MSNIQEFERIGKKLSNSLNDEEMLFLKEFMLKLASAGHKSPSNPFWSYFFAAIFNYCLGFGMGIWLFY